MPRRFRVSFCIYLRSIVAVSAAMVLCLIMTGLAATMASARASMELLDVDVALLAGVVMAVGDGVSSPDAAADVALGGALAGDVRLWKNAKSDFDVFTTDQSYASFINATYEGMLVYEPYFDSRTSWYEGAALFNKDAYAIYTDPAKNKDGATIDWALRDADDSLCYIPYEAPYDQYAGDIGSSDFRDNWVGYVVQKLNSVPGYEGVFIDDVNLGISRVACGSPTSPRCDPDTAANCPIDPRTGQVMTNEDWKRYVVEFLEQVRAALPGKLIAHNSIWYIVDFDDPYLARELAAGDIIQMEQGFVDNGLKGGTGKYSWVRKMEFVALVHSYGKVVIDRDEKTFTQEIQSYGLANFLLLNNGHDFYDPVYQSVPDDWWTGYEANLGHATSEVYSWNGLWRRDFQNGIALVNPPGDTGVVAGIDLGSTYTDLYGQQHSSVTLDDKQGLILRSDSVTATPTPSPSPASPTQTTPTPTTPTSTTPAPTPTSTTATLTATGTPRAGQTVSWGDANCSGSADPVDSLLTLGTEAGLPANTGDCPALGTTVDVAFASLHVWGDVDCSGAVTPVDSLKLLRSDAGLSVTQEAGCPPIGSSVTIVEV